MVLIHPRKLQHKSLPVQSYLWHCNIFSQHGKPGFLFFPRSLFGFVFCSQIKGPKQMDSLCWQAIFTAAQRDRNLLFAEFVLESGQILSEPVPVLWVQALIYVGHKFIKTHGNMIPLIRRLQCERNEGHHINMEMLV